MKSRSRSNLEQISEINLTPLMDLTFILLITFIITFPLIEQGIPLDLPKSDADPIDDPTTRTISVDKAGAFYLDDIAITPGDLAIRMRDLKTSLPDATVLVRADEALRYGKVMEVVKILHDAKISRMGLVTEAEGQ